jgi:FKBP-type peptidyl-prolyl cis-trans isomerase
MRNTKLALLLLGVLLLPLLTSCTSGENGDEVTTNSAETGPMPPGAWTDEVVETYSLGKQGQMLVEIFTKGTGPVVEEFDRVKVHYQGWIPGRQGFFDSSIKTDKPIEFAVGTKSVIGGWDLGITGMTVGTRARLHIPPGLGYGERGNPPMIPRSSKLLFDIEILGIR